MKKSILIISLLFFSLVAKADIQISKLADIQFGKLYPTPAAPDYQHDIQVCVYTTNPQLRNYEVNATVIGENTFKLRNGSSLLPIELWWNGAANITGGQQLSSSTPLTVSNSSASTSADCAGGAVADLNVIIRGRALYAINAGVYSATISLTLSPL